MASCLCSERIERNCIISISDTYPSSTSGSTGLFESFSGGAVALDSVQFWLARRTLRMILLDMTHENVTENPIGISRRSAYGSSGQMMPYHISISSSYWCSCPDKQIGEVCCEHAVKIIRQKKEGRGGVLTLQNRTLNLG